MTKILLHNLFCEVFKRWYRHTQQQPLIIIPQEMSVRPSSPAFLFISLAVWGPKRQIIKHTF